MGSGASNHSKVYQLYKTYTEGTPRETITPRKTYKYENTIQDELNNYNSPHPPKQIINSIRKNGAISLFDDRNYTGGNGEDSSQEDNSSQEDISPKISFTEIDAHARKATTNIGETFDGLIDYLMEGIKDKDHFAILLARAIIVWMSVQNDVQHSKLQIEANCRNPNGLIQCLIQREMSYSTCYAILCRYANLQCVRTTGYTKGRRYEPGDSDLRTAKWNAVHGEFGWQIVQPEWICKSLLGHSTGKWVKVEQDGKSVVETSCASDGLLVNTFRERYFMPDPEVFLYECCAINPMWQLVDSKSVVTSQRQFGNMPYLLPHFFAAGLSLKSEPRCKVRSTDGICKIEMKGNAINAETLTFRYQLFLKFSNNMIPGFETCDKHSQMVCNLRARTLFTFEVRFPNTGKYKLVIYGGPHRSAQRRLIETKLVCKKAMVGRNLLPLDCPEIGWGPGPFCRAAGLLMPSKVGGVINLPQNDKKAELSFHLQDTTKKYSAECHGEVGGRVQKIDDSVSISKSDQKKMLTVTTSIQQDGEFGVAINSVEENTEETNVCNYLLSTLSSKDEAANVKRARERLKDTLAEDVGPEKWSKKIADIETCIENCQSENISDTDEDIIYTMDELKLLNFRKLLRDCHLQKDLDVIRKTMVDVLRYENRLLLETEIDDVLHLADTLAREKGQPPITRKDFMRKKTKRSQARQKDS